MTINLNNYEKNFKTPIKLQKTFRISNPEGSKCFWSNLD